MKYIKEASKGIFGAIGGYLFAQLVLYLQNQMSVTPFPAELKALLAIVGAIVAMKE